MKLINLKDYKRNKQAKVMLPQIDIILTIFNLSIKGLEHFRAYIPVAKVLAVIKEQKAIMEMHKDKLTKITKEQENEKK